MRLAELKKQIRDEQAIKAMLEKMPQKVADSFSEEQLTHLFTIISSKSWAKHSIDLRGTFKIPFYKWRFYYVFLTGKNHRDLSRKEKELSLMGKAMAMSSILIVCAFIGLLVLYLIKSALGINLLPDHSFGIWDWFKSLWN